MSTAELSSSLLFPLKAFLQGPASPTKQKWKCLFTGTVPVNKNILRHNFFLESKFFGPNNCFDKIALLSQTEKSECGTSQPSYKI